MSDLKENIIELADGYEYYVVDTLKLDNKSYLYMSKLSEEEDKELLFVEYRDGLVYSIEDDETIKNCY